MKCNWDCFNCELDDCIRGDTVSPAIDRYVNSEKGIATREAYNKSSNRQDAIMRYNKSIKRKEALKRYNNTEKAKACRARYKQRKRLEAMRNDTVTGTI